MESQSSLKLVLVAGGARFLASHLCERLLKNGGDVIYLDNLFTGSKDNVRHLVGFFPWIFARNLRSKTWSDYEKMSGKT
jgi:nucleoside-diphosphate-sugar epimerase